MAGLFKKTIEGQPHHGAPLWFMRQAGRYHGHYQSLRKQHGFVDLCKVPELATEVTMGPIRDFDFDAAILFSDILFPLESLGIPLDYNPAPSLGFHLEKMSDFEKLSKTASTELVKTLSFQGRALKMIREQLPRDKGLIGFVGAPFTLYCFATCGSHKKDLTLAMTGLEDGRFKKFLDVMEPLLIENICMQLSAGCDLLALFDTCGGELSGASFLKYNVPSIKRVLNEVKKRHPDSKILYYSKKTTAEHWNQLVDCPIDVLGVDWNVNLSQVLKDYSKKWIIQGNYDPEKLRDFSLTELERDARSYFEELIRNCSKDSLQRWVSGLGHGVLPLTPEENVKLFIRLHRSYFPVI